MMQDKVKVEVLDITEDSDEEKLFESEPVKSEPISPIIKSKNVSDSEYGEPSGLQNSPNGSFIRNSEKSLDKAITEIKKGHSLVAVASQYGVSPDVLYNKLVSQSLPRETDVLTPTEESNLINWVVKSNKNNRLIFKQQLMEKVGKFKKVVKITPIFAKSKFGLMWYEYFMKSHPEIHENEGLLMPSDEVLASTQSQEALDNQQVPTLDPEKFDILTSDEEDNLVKWIITSNQNNCLIFKFDLMRRVGKLNKVVKVAPGFAKSKLGRMWYEHFLKNHPEIYENDELLLPSENVTESSQWPDEEDIQLAQDVFKTPTVSTSIAKDPSDLLRSHGIKDSVVVLHDCRMEKNSPIGLSEKVKVENNIENPIKEENEIEHEPSLEILDFEGKSTSVYVNESGIESDQHSSDKEDNDLYKPSIQFRKRKRKKYKKCKDKPVCNKCARSFCNHSKLKRHMLTVHRSGGLTEVTCLHCYKTFPSKYHLSVHMTNVHTTTYHECDECGKQFKFRSSMRKHQRTVHEGLESPEIFYCDICKKAFKYKNSLEAHIIYGHLKEKKKFSCNICKMSFVRHSLMLRHKTRHSKIKPMACMHCSKTFSRKYLLRHHIREVHNSINCSMERDETSKEYLSEIVID